MVWTHKKPEMPGWYWIKIGSGELIVRVFDFGDDSYMRDGEYHYDKEDWEDDWMWSDVPIPKPIVMEA